MRAARSWTRLALVLALGIAPAFAQDASPPKTIVLAFDGLDHGLVELFGRQGRLPHLTRLAEQGTFQPLATSNPVSSPASWGVFNTGTNPGKTGLSGFITRHFWRGSDGRAVGQPMPRPMLGFPTELDVDDGRFSRVPYEINPMQGTPWWRYLDAAGVRVTGVQIPMTFPPDAEGASTRLLSGLGLKDIAGTPGSWSVFTDDPWSTEKTTNTAGKIRKIYFDEEGGAAASAVLPGPRDWVAQMRYEDEIAELTSRLDDLDDLEDTAAETAPLDARLRALQAEFTDWRRRHAISTAPFRVRADRDAGTLAFDVQGTAFTLGEGEWSDLVPVSFALAEENVEHGLVRFCLLTCDFDEVRIFAAPVQVDPRQPSAYLPISAPPGFAAELAEGIGGPYETLGWACMTNPLKDTEDSHFGAQQFLEGVESLLHQREALLTHGLDHAADWDVYVQVFTTPDRVAHMLFREFDPEHPLHDGAYASREMAAFRRSFALGDAIPQIYEQADRVVGDVAARVGAGEFGDDCLLLVVSDHGFTSFRRQVNLNNALYDLGYLTFKDGQTLEQVLAGRRSNLLSFVDWDTTRAYSLGLGKIFVNLAGREPNGIVDRADYDGLVADIQGDLLELTDPQGGARLVTSAHRRDALFDGPWVREGRGLPQKVAGETRTLDHWDGFADIFVGFAPTYRVSWACTMGGLDPQAVVDNENHWSGGHVSVDPSHVPGVLFANRRLPPGAAPGLIDVGPTILARHGVDLARTDVDGAALPLESPAR